MRPYLGPIQHMRIMTRNTPMGQKFYFVHENWENAEYNYQEYRAALRARKRAQIEKVLADMITNGKKSEQKDLFV